MLRSYSTEIEKWKEGKAGLNPLEIVIGVTLPEIDGGIEPIFVSGLESFENPNFRKAKGPRVLEDRVKKLCERIKNWIALRKIPNSEKRVAIIVYNYPPGEENLASAGYLDVFESLKAFLEKLRERGYKVEIPEKPLEVIREILQNKQIKWLPKGYDEFVKGIVGNIKFSESDALLRALEGKYILPARAGDPIRDPEVYPTGKAMYGFDPRLIPMIAAEVRGKKAADLLIDQYLKKYGKYPESVGIVLWGFETMKTGGDTVATILSLLGVRIKHLKSPWFKELEIIPLEELKRPRIDVVVTICGIFRDVFGMQIDLINRAIEVVAKLDEPLEKNYVRKHFLELKGELEDFALARIFGPSPTEYATSMRTLVESGEWKDEKDLVKSYEDSMSYAYFKGKVEKHEKAFSSFLKLVDIVTQERDNTEYEVTDLDHYYEFLGGLSRTVQEKRGEKADVLVIDTTEEDVLVEDLKLSIERATRTRLLNPLWIEGMLKHDFHGAKKIKDRVEYILAFAATTGKVENWIFDEVAEK